MKEKNSSILLCNLLYFEIFWTFHSMLFIIATSLMFKHTGILPLLLKAATLRKSVSEAAAGTAHTAGYVSQSS